MDSNEFIYGYIKDPYNPNNFILDYEAAKIVKYIFYSKVNGSTDKEIIDNLNLRGIPTISKYEKNNNFSFSFIDHKNWTENDIKLIINNTLYLGSNSKINRINSSTSIFKNVEPLIDEVIFKIIHPEYQNNKVYPMPSKNNNDYILDKYYIPFGYTVDFKSIKILIKEKREAGIIKDIFNYKIKGKTSQQISDLLNSYQIFFTYRYLINTGLNYKLCEKNSLWFVSIVDNILTNEIYKGISLKSDVDYNFFKSSETIIDDVIFDRVIKEIESESIKGKDKFENNNNPQVKIINKFNKHNTCDKDKNDNGILEKINFDLDKEISQLEEDFQKINFIDSKEKLSEYHKILNETIYSKTEIKNKNESSLENGKDNRTEFISKERGDNNEINIFNSIENEKSNGIQSNYMNSIDSTEINISNSYETLVNDNSTIDEINMPKIHNLYEILSDDNSTTINEINTPNMTNSYETLFNNNSTINEINISNLPNLDKILVNSNSTINKMNDVINDSKSEEIIKWDSINENKSKNLDNYNNLNIVIDKNISQDKLKINSIYQYHSDKNNMVSLCHTSNIINNSIINDQAGRNNVINNKICNEYNIDDDENNVRNNLISDNNNNSDKFIKEEQIITDKELLNSNEGSYEDNKDSYDFYNHINPPPYGYKYTDNYSNKLSVDKEAASIVKDIFQKSFQGYSKQKIVDYLNSKEVLSIYLYRKKKGLEKKSRVRAKKWNISSINNILSDITYIGHTKMDSAQNNNTVEYNTHEAIIKESIFNIVNSTKSRKSIAPYGYKYDFNDPQKLVIQEETASIVRLIFQWTTLGKTFIHIVEKLNLRKAVTLTEDKISKGGNVGSSKNRWNEAHISTILHDETYMGHTVGEEITYNTHEPIISEDKFNEAHYILEKRKRDNRIAMCNSNKYKFSTPLPPYGYTYFNKSLIINEESAKIVKKIFSEIISGKSIRSIANQLNDNNVMTIAQYHYHYCNKYNKKWDCWGLPTIRSIVTDLTYLGHTTFYRERKIKAPSSSSKKNKNEKILCIGKRNTHKAIIDEETFKLAQLFIKR
ncbi:hypothetical protein H8356DRAFT_1743187 [Neocallimastix lanati (nom. inval.)]|nr:hypothetical protein H8356DRAFT_1743187 [Neocallimastix sp. JGI-2020a]